jgi:CBS domain-containing protein
VIQHREKAGTLVAFQLQLHKETVERTCSTKPLCVEPGKSVRDVLLAMKEHRRGSVSICDQGVLVGIFTERDALRLMAERASLDVPIEQVMTRNPATVSAQETIGAAIVKMSKGGYRRLPVIDGAGHAIGLLKVSEILHYLVQHFPKFVYNLPPNSKQITATREGA